MNAYAILAKHIYAADQNYNGGSEVMKTSDKLKSVLCNPDDEVCISGSDEDRKILQNAIAEVENMEQNVSEPVIRKLGDKIGDKCNRNGGCDGIMTNNLDDVSCSCHINNPPCSKCTDDYVYCPKCEWNVDGDES